MTHLIANWRGISPINHDKTVKIKRPGSNATRSNTRDSGRNVCARHGRALRKRWGGRCYVSHRIPKTQQGQCLTNRAKKGCHLAGPRVAGMDDRYGLRGIWPFMAETLGAFTVCCLCLWHGCFLWVLAMLWQVAMVLERQYAGFAWTAC